MPRAALNFLSHFYPRGKTNPARRRDVFGQVQRTLTVGAKFGRPARIARALTPERLAAKCLEVMQESLRDPDKAIVVLLTKLADTTSLVEAETRQASIDRTAESSEGISRLAEAEAWLLTDDPAAITARTEVGRFTPLAERKTLREPERIAATAASWNRTIRLLELFTLRNPA